MLFWTWYSLPVQYYRRQDFQQLVMHARKPRWSETVTQIDLYAAARCCQYCKTKDQMLIELNWGECKLNWNLGQGSVMFINYINFNTLTPVPAVTSVGLCFSSDIIPMTKIGIICTQFLQEKKIFMMIPRSVIGSVEAEICMKMTEKPRAKLSVITRWCSLRIFWTGRKRSRRSITAAKR